MVGTVLVEIHARRQHVADGRLPGVERLRRVRRVAACLGLVGFGCGASGSVGMLGKDAADHEVIEPLYFAREFGDTARRGFALGASRRVRVLPPRKQGVAEALGEAVVELVAFVAERQLALQEPARSVSLRRHESVD